MAEYPGPPKAEEYVIYEYAPDYLAVYRADEQLAAGFRDTSDAEEWIRLDIDRRSGNG